MADNQFINFNSQDVADMYRRNQYARMLQEQAAAPIERASYKGIEAPIQPTQAAAKIASALLAGYQQNRMDESYANEKSAAEQKMMAEQERRRGEVADYQKGFEPTLSAGPSGGAGDYGTPETISTPKSRGELLAHAMRGIGSDIPQVANMGRMQYEQQNAMAQDEARAARDEITRKDMLAGREQTQSNADRTYGLQLETLKQGRLPTAAAQEKAAEKEQGATNAATTIKQLREDYNSLNKIGGLRNLDQNVAGRSAASLANVLPYALQNKDAAMLRERIDANIESLVGPLMRASGMSTQMLNSNVERAAFMRTLGGTNTSLETNMSILDRMNDTLNYDPKKKDKGDVPDNTDAKLKSVMDMYAPKRK